MNKILSIVFFIICVYVQPTHAQYSIGSGNSWMILCNSPYTEDICEYYTQGIIEAWLASFHLFKQGKELQVEELFCIEKTHSTKQHILVIKNFMEQNPSKLHNSASLLIFDAMFKAFPPPCNRK